MTEQRYWIIKYGVDQEEYRTYRDALGTASRMVENRLTTQALIFEFKGKMTPRPIPVKYESIWSSAADPGSDDLPF